MPGSLVRGSLLVGGLTASLALLGHPALGEGPPTRAATTVVAGDGLLGTRDGAAASAEFLMPSGLARGANGDLYVSDEAAQTIRLISNGRVTTLAGGGTLGPGAASVEGGFRDGPAADARFDRPSGIALGSAGTLYVADTGNAAIRTIAHGNVATFAGKAGERGDSDGPATLARFRDPRALAFDPAGNLYVADFGNGIRKIDTSGAVSTLALGIDDKQTWGVAVGGTNGDVVYASTPTRVIVRDLHSGTTRAFGRFDSAEGAERLGSAYQLAALGGREMLFSDLVGGNVRYFRDASPPFVGGPFTRSLVGGTSRAFGAPNGLAVGSGRVYVADSQRRRIESFSLPPTRVSETGTNDRVPRDGKHLEIALIGPSYTFWDSLGDDSICGEIEATLNTPARAGKPARCHAIRIDDGGLPQVADYLREYGEGRFDVVAILLDDNRLRGIFPGGAVPERSEERRAAFRAFVTTSLLPAIGADVRTTLLWVPLPWEVSNAEGLFYRRATTELAALTPGPSSDAIARDALASIVGLPIVTGDLFSAALAHERGVDPELIVNSDDPHPRPAGNRFIARGELDLLRRTGAFGAMGSPAPAR